MNRKKIVAGNWKMNLTMSEAEQLVDAIVKSSGTIPSDTEVIVCPPFIYLEQIKRIAGDKLSVGAQNCHQNESGAYTGEVSASMIQSLGIDYVIIGHSERREYFQESNELLSKKVRVALKNGLRVIYCVGEKLEEREGGHHFELVKRQLVEGLEGVTNDEMSNVIVAYEPVWAIGTGKTATSAQAQEMHQYIRGVVSEMFNPDIAQGIHLLYGGSCKPDNAKELFNQEDVDGGLIGGAALKAESFLAIIQS